MLQIIEIIFGVPFTNKLRIALGNTQRSPFTQMFLSFADVVKKRWINGGSIIRFLMVVVPILNLFYLFSGVFTMFFLLFVDFCLFRYICRA